MGGSWSQDTTTPSGSRGERRNKLDILKEHRAHRTHKMVFVANMALKMGRGKLAAQVGHAAISVFKKAMRDDEGEDALSAWEDNGSVKIVLRAENTEQLIELQKKAEELGLYNTVIHDAGFTQVEPGSRTVLGIFGEKEKVDLVTGTLKMAN